MKPKAKTIILYDERQLLEQLAKLSDEGDRVLAVVLICSQERQAAGELPN